MIGYTQILLMFWVNLIPMGNGGTWKEWSQHVIQSIERLNSNIKEINVKITNIHDDITKLKLKCKIIWGLLGGLLGALATLIVLILAGVVRYG